MSKVVVEGWHDPRNPKPLSLVDAMRRHAGLSLPGAKKLLDVFTEHGKVVVMIDSEERAKAFSEAALTIGAIVRVVQSDD